MLVRRSVAAVVVLGLVVLSSSNAVRAADPNPCNSLPNGGTLRMTVPGVSVDPACNTDCSGKMPRGLPVPSNPMLAFTGSDHAQCEITQGPARGACKQDTVCPPATSRVTEGGVVKCKRPDETKSLECPKPPAAPKGSLPPAPSPNAIAADGRAKLAAISSDVQRRGLAFQTGMTGAMNRTLAQLTGLRLPPNFAQLVREKYDKTAPQVAGLSSLGGAGCAALPKFSWVEKLGDKMPAIRDQKKCGSCWAFSAMGAFEMAIANGGGTFVNAQRVASFDGSEQFLLECASAGPPTPTQVLRVDAGSCNGGFEQMAFDFLTTYGTLSEMSRPYTGNDAPSRSCLASSPRGAMWSYVRPDLTPGSVAELKDALCKNGALAGGMLVGEAFQGYTGGVYDEVMNGPPNHAMLIVGWDDTKRAWIVRNSWGNDWGTTVPGTSERGYAYVKYGLNGLGVASAWIR